MTKECWIFHELCYEAEIQITLISTMSDCPAQRWPKFAVDSKAVD